MEEDDDLPQLSAETFAALQEFYNEQEQKELVKQSSETVDPDINFEENWVRTLLLVV